MSDELLPEDPLTPVVRALARPVPIPAGLADRAQRRRSRQRRRRFTTGVAALATLLVVGLQFRASGTAVTFDFSAPAVRSVTLVGDFTDWRADKVQLRRDASGEWHTTLRLAPGRYRFAYVVDRDQWRADSHAAPAPDDFGRPTSVLTVAGH